MNGFNYALFVNLNKYEDIINESFTRQSTDSKRHDLTNNYMQKDANYFASPKSNIQNATTNKNIKLLKKFQNRTFQSSEDRIPESKQVKLKFKGFNAQARCIFCTNMN